MNQQPDKFFRDKLENFSKPAPLAAWDKLEAGLDKKNNKGLWWKVAASLLLLCVATGTLYVISQDDKGATIADRKNNPSRTEEPTSSKPTEIVAEEKSSTPEAQNLAVQKKETNTVTAKKSNRNRRSPEVQPVKEQPDQQPEIPSVEEVPAEQNNVAVNTPSEVPAVEEPVVTKEENTVVSTTQPGLTLVYSVEEANGYLNKNSTSDATDDEKKSSTFKKLLKKAQDLKNNQDPFGELRQKKNEILALNFKNEKRGQNKQ